MEIYLETLLGILIPQVVAGMLGGIIGGFGSARIDLYGWRLSIIFFIIAVFSAGAFAEFITYTFNFKFILVHLVGGVGIGILVNSGLDSLLITAPSFMTKLIDILADGFLAVLKEIPNLIIRKIEDIFRWIKIFFNKENNNE